MVSSTQNWCWVWNDLLSCTTHIVSKCTYDFCPTKYVGKVMFPALFSSRPDVVAVPGYVDKLMTSNLVRQGQTFYSYLYHRLNLLCNHSETLAHTDTCLPPQGNWATPSTTHQAGVHHSQPLSVKLALVRACTQTLPTTGICDCLHPNSTKKFSTSRVP